MTVTVRELELLREEIEILKRLVIVKQKLLAVGERIVGNTPRDEPYDRDGYGAGSDGS